MQAAYDHKSPIEPATTLPSGFELAGQLPNNRTSTISGDSTRNTWPPTQLFNVADQQTGAEQLVHLAILIGVLLGLVAMITLISRKLLLARRPSASSYKWLLARQTVGGKGKSPAAIASCAACAQLKRQLCAAEKSPFCGSHAARQHFVACQSVASSGNSTATILLESPQQHQIGALNELDGFCRAPTLGQPQSCELSVDCSPKQIGQQVFVDFNGNHFLGGGGSRSLHGAANSFSGGGHIVSHTIDPVNEALYADPSICCSSSSQRRRRRQMSSKSQRNSEGNYNYDTLSSSYCAYDQPELVGRYAPNETENGETLSGQGDFLLLAAEGDGEGEPSGESDNLHLKAKTRTRGASNQRAEGKQVKTKGATCEKEQRLPERVGSDRRKKSKSFAAQRASATSRVGTNSSTSSSSSVSGGAVPENSTSSTSVQSSTAQMLSNAASSSFEQTPEIELDAPKLEVASRLPKSGHVARVVQQVEPLHHNQKINQLNSSLQLSNRQLTEQANRQQLSNRARDQENQTKECNSSNRQTNRRRDSSSDKQQEQFESSNRTSQCDTESERHYYEEIHQNQTGQ